jgi:hypothetical protein
MSPTPTVPVTMQPEAAARLAELGMQREYEQILEHALQTVPGLRSIEVQLALPYDTGDETTIVLEAIREGPAQVSDPFYDEWRDWIIGTFPPDVWSRIRLMSIYGNSP